MASTDHRALVWANVKDAVASPFYRNTLFNNIDPSFIEQQESIPGYDKLFGSLQRQGCDPADSIFGPVAYFVDLMRFVENKIVIGEGGVALTDRRADLLDLPLDGRTALDPIPHLELVNEVLAALVRTEDEPDADRVLAAAVRPFALPYDHSLQRLRAYAAALQTSLSEIHRRLVVGSPPVTAAGEELGLSPRDLDLLASPVDLRTIYGGDGTEEELVAKLGPRSTFALRTGLVDEEIRRLVESDLAPAEIRAGLQRRLHVNDVDGSPGPLALVEPDPALYQITELALRRLAAEPVATDPDDLAALEPLLDEEPMSEAELRAKVGSTAGIDPTTAFGSAVLRHARRADVHLTNLTPAKLERIYQVVRVAASTGWSIPDTDRVLRSLARPRPLETAPRLDGRTGLRADAVNGLDLTTLTIEAWVRPDGSGTQPILAKGAEDDHVVLAVDGDGRLVLEATLDQRVVGRHPLPPGAFSHIAVVVDDRTVRFLVDGELDLEVADGLDAPIPSSGAALLVGRDFAGQHFDGIITELRIWDTARADTSIRANRHRRLSGTEDALAGYWPLTSERWYGTADQVATNDLSVPADDWCPPVWVRPRLVLEAPAAAGAMPRRSSRRPLDFDGTALLPLDDPAGIAVEPSAQRTIEVWFRTEAGKRDQPSVLYDEGGVGGAINLVLDEDRRLWWGELCGLRLSIVGGALLFEGYDTLGDHDSWPGVRIEGPSVNDGRWHHAALVVDARAGRRPGPTFQAYVDGRPVGDADRGPSEPFWVVARNRIIGGAGEVAKDGATPFVGQVLDVRLWHVARSADELRDRWFDDGPAGEPGLASRLVNGADRVRFVDIAGWSDDGTPGLADATDPTLVEPLQGTADRSIGIAPEVAGIALPFGDDTVRSLAEIGRLRDSSGIPLGRLTALWATPDEAGTGSPESLLDAVLGSGTDAGARPVPLVWDRGTNPPAESDRRTESRLMTVLGLSPAALRAAVDNVTAGRDVVVIDEFLLARLDRQSLAASLLGLDLVDLGRAQERFGVRAVDGLADFLRLERGVRWMDRCGLDLAALDDLVDGWSADGRPHDLAEDDIRSMAAELRPQLSTTDGSDRAPERLVAERDAIIRSHLATLVEADEALIAAATGSAILRDDTANLAELIVGMGDHLPVPAALDHHLGHLRRLLRLLAAFELTIAGAVILLDRPEILGLDRCLLAPSLADLERLDRYRNLVEATGRHDAGPGLLDLLGGPAGEFDPAVVADRTGWAEPDVAVLIGRFAAEAPGDDRLRLLDRVRGVIDLGRRTTVDVGALVALADAPSDAEGDPGRNADHANGLLAALRVRHGAGFPAIHGPILEGLAAHRRDALLATAMSLLGEDFEGRRSPDVLFQYLLLDVQAGPEVMTSRIVQATAGVQLYVQRCLMNLEPGVEVRSDAAEQWRWMRNYRVWEANRKVFLYPENFVEPELRSTKSPLFERLENALMEGEITREAVERAYVQYLDGFAEIANLKVTGAYKYRNRVESDDADDSQDDATVEETLFLVGRTETRPRLYYTRRAEVLADGFRWHPWERVELTINSDFVTPVFAFNKLFLFWAELTRSKLDETGKTGETKQPATVTPTIKYSYYNLDRRWVQPQTFLEVDADLDEVERHFPEWQRVYAQRSTALVLPEEVDATPPPGRVFELRRIEPPVQGRVESNGLPGSTWSFWVKFVDQGLGGLSSSAGQSTTLFEYADRAPESVSLGLVDVDAIVESTFRLVATDNVELDPDVATAISRARAQLETADGLLGDLAEADELAADVEDAVKAGDFDDARTDLTALLELARPARSEDGDLVAQVESKATSLRRAMTTATGQNATRAQKAAPAARAAELSGLVDELHSAIGDVQVAKAAALTEAEQRPRYRSTSVGLSIQRTETVVDLSPPLSGVARVTRNDTAIDLLDVEHDVWHHVALSMIYDAGTGGYRIEVFDNGVSKKTAAGLGAGYEASVNLLGVELVSVKRPAPPFRSGTVTIGRAPAGPRRTKVRMTEFRVWDRLRDGVQIGRDRSKRKTGREAGLVLHLPLDGPDTETTRTIMPASADDATQQSEKDWVTANRERIILFYGDTRRSMRNNLDDQNFDLVPDDRSPDPTKRSFDLKLSLNTLHLTKTDGLSLNGFTTAGTSNLKRFTPEAVRYLAGERDGLDATRREQIDLILGDFNTEATGFESSYSLLRNLRKFEVSLQDVHNQPGWYILDSGDEQFLIEADLHDTDDLETAEDRLEVGYNELRSPTDTQQVSIGFGPPTAGLLVKPDPAQPTQDLAPGFSYRFHRLSTFAIHTLSSALFRGGLDALLDITTQRAEEIPFESEYGLADANRALVIGPRAGEESPNTIDFEGPNGQYYREIFFHIPFLIANRLNANQRFEEAERWYHYIFDPTSTDDPPDLRRNDKDRYWRYLPFRGLGLEALQRMLSNEEALDEYREDPFDPHAIARLRLNAYQKAVVMRYLDNLLDWGDALFQQNSRESVNEAAMLYVRAFDLLGPRPTLREGGHRPVIGTWRSIRDQGPDNVPDFLVPPVPSSGSADAPTGGLRFDFCVPENDRFVKYWDRVEDRLSKIRHSLDFEGVARDLALLAPPLDPAALVRAATVGRDVAGTLGGQPADVPHYRFPVVLQRARAVTANVVALGAALLAAIEKRDTAQLVSLQSTQRDQVLRTMRQVVEGRRDEAEASVDALRRSLESTRIRQRHYRSLADAELLPVERANLAQMEAVLGIKIGATAITGLSILGHLAPNTFGFANGGMKFGDAINAGAQIAQGVADVINHRASMTAIVGQYERRSEDWRFQVEAATNEIAQMEKQIEAAEIRSVIAEHELRNQELEIEHNREVEEFHHRKFSNEALYDWMVGRLSSLYFQSYRMARELARSAERALQYELVVDTGFVAAGHWDNLKRGLLAGESLQLDLDRMERAYLDGNARTLELQRTISLLRLDPLAVLALKATGSCTFALPESLFAHDYPGHYCRQIKAVEVTIPAIVGPYQQVKATLTQTSNDMITRPDIDAVRHLLGVEGVGEPEEGVIRSNLQPNQQVAISRGVSDSGLFRLDFNDERYLPFEGTGAVSTWRLDMPRATNEIDFDTITDVIIQLSYSARSDEGPFKRAVQGELATTSGYRLVSLAQGYPSAWDGFVRSGGGPSSLSFQLPDDLFPTNLEGGATVNALTILADPGPTTAVLIGLSTTGPEGARHALQLDPADRLAGVPIDPARPWSIEADGDVTGLRDLWIALEYEGRLAW